MKKILVSLLVLALCAPAMAATISIVDLGGGQAEVTIDSTADGVPIVGLGLDVDVTAGAVTAVDVAGLVTQKFDIFPDAAYTQELGAGYLYGTGTPVAAKTVPGEVALSDSFALSFANLNGESTPGANGATIVTVVLTLSETADLTVCENATRGGIVATDGTGLVADCATETITVGGDPECVNSGASFYADWIAWGSPDCWCYAKNCLGDFDGLAQGNALAGYAYVLTDDLNPFLAAYNIKEPPKGPGIAVDQICADFNHAAQGNALAGYARVLTDDLNILLANYNIKEAPKGPGIGDCAGADYNFFVTP